MPKHDFFSPKAISNRIKSKGLQKLRWYCEMCQKQCRDENGFKCHQTSDSHLRQMRIFAEDPSSVMSNFSTEFEEYFIETLSRRHGTKRVHVNIVYQEYIADKNHVHMNATRWTTLSNFCMYLGKAGIAAVDETEKGWYIAWINRDPAALARQAQLDKKRKHDLDDEERQRRELQRRVRAAGGEAASSAAPEPSGDLRRDGGDLVKVKVGLSAAPQDGAPAPARAPALARPIAFAQDSDESDSAEAAAPPQKKRALDSLMRVDAEARAKVADDEAAGRGASWLHAHIVVKVMNKQLAGGKYHKKKATVTEVVSDFIANVAMHDSGDSLQLDQDDLECADAARPDLPAGRN